MQQPSIGFIGFGEAGSAIAGGLRSAGIDRLYAFDINADTPPFGPRIRQRAEASGTALLASPAELAEASDLVFSTVTSSAALDAARQTEPFLESRHMYADLNSVSPARKQEVGAVIVAAGAAFVEAAVMAPVAPFGMRVDVLATTTIGAASAVKMCRSILVKGLEALMCECVLGASQYAADDHVFASVNESFPGIDWKKLADYMIGRVAVHGERRARELEEVAETLRAIGVEPIMAEATAKRQDSIARLGVSTRFGPEGPRTYRDLLDAINEVRGV